MSLGNEMLAKQLFKVLGLDGAAVMAQLAGIGEFVASVRRDLNDIKARQDLIMRALNIPVPRDPIDEPFTIEANAEKSADAGRGNSDGERFNGTGTPAGDVPINGAAVQRRGNDGAH